MADLPLQIWVGDYWKQWVLIFQREADRVENRGSNGLSDVKRAVLQQWSWICKWWRRYGDFNYKWKVSWDELSLSIMEFKGSISDDLPTTDKQTKQHDAAGRPVACRWTSTRTLMCTTTEILYWFLWEEGLLRTDLKNENFATNFKFLSVCLFIVEKSRTVVFCWPPESLFLVNKIWTCTANPQKATMIQSSCCF